MKSVAEIRREFLEYFKERAHTVVRSAPVVPREDPTLLFTNAGMNQFKDVFLGTGSREYTRAADTQKCIRAGGKHNDLEEVGRDTYHHTFFEMLGNWSFGDYYKKEAITWAWDLLTNVWGLDKSRMYATVYRTDNEAMELWKSETDIDPNNILLFDEKDNFWEMADTGPCGPCTEIHFDLGPGPDDDPNIDPRSLVNADSERVIEIWNLVFIQFERQADGSLIDLPHKHVDTGMGLERVTAVLQKVRSNYDTDIFKPLIAAISEVTGAAYDPGMEGRRHRAIADHLRALSFSIADGAIIGSNGRDYVLRRILRRASRFLGELGMTEPCLYKLVPTLADQMHDVFPELRENQDHIIDLIKTEEQLFMRTLARGLKRFGKVAKTLAAENKTIIDGSTAFDLHQTYGFLIDLTQQMAQEHGFTVDLPGFQKCLKAEQAEGRRTQTFNKTDLGRFASLQATKFLGYDQEVAEQVQVLSAGKDELVLDRTPFYPEGGGPKGDQGSILGNEDDGFEFQVEDTQRLGDVIVHRGRFLAGSPETAKGSARATVDTGYRDAIRRNHTGTHILHWALRTVLGTKIKQQGSVIKPESFTFDFTYPKALSPSALDEIERLINERIMAADDVTTTMSDPESAVANGALGLFEGKYGEEVRVLSLGDGYSTELCGGIHCHNTGEIGSLKILKESSIKSGVRRIEAVTGAFAIEAAIANHKVVAALSTDLKVPPSELLGRIHDILKQVKALKKQIKQGAGAKTSAKDLIKGAKDIDGVQVLVQSIEGDVNALRKIGDSIKAQKRSTVALLFATNPKGVNLLATCTKDLTAKGWHAGELLKLATSIVGGGGGGRPEFAQGKGKNPDKVDEAVSFATQSIADKIKGL